MSRKSLKSAMTVLKAKALLAGTGLLMSFDASACCSCCACGPCVSAVLEIAENASNMAFDALGSAQDGLDQAIDLGQQAEMAAINIYGDNIVGALNAQASSVTAELTRGSVTEQKLVEALKESIERTSRTDLVARENLEAATAQGFENVSHVAKKLTTVQNAKIIERDPTGANPTPTEIDATVHLMLATVERRSQRFLRGMINAEESDRSMDTVTMTMLYEGAVGSSFTSAVVLQPDWPEAIAARRYLVAPPSVQANMRSIDMGEGDQTGYWRVAQRSKAAAEFMAWELALRSEIETSQGSTSLINFLDKMVVSAYEDTEGILDDGTAYKRELLNTVSTNLALSNMLDMLMVEVGRYQTNMEGAKVGFYNDFAFNPVFGNYSGDLPIESSVEQ